MPDPQPSPIIISAQMLTDFLGETSTVSQPRTVIAEDTALGWLADALEVPDDFEWTPYAQHRTVRAWVLELAAIAWENPTSLESDSSDDVSSRWADRRLQILDAAKAWARRSGLTAAPAAALPLSQGAFPPAPGGPRFDRPTSW